MILKKIDEYELREVLTDLGYTIRDPDKTKRFKEQQQELDEGKKKLLMSAVPSFIIAGMMLYMLFKGMIFELMGPPMRILSLALAIFTMFVPGLYIKKKAFFSIKRGVLNQHVLLEGGAFAALSGGIFGLSFFPHFPTVHFFAVATFLTAYHILSEYTSLLVRTKATTAVEKLLDLRPETARKVTDEGTKKVRVEELDVKDKVRIKPGEKVPIDGEVLEGESTVDESIATGESEPQDKKEGDEVIGGSINRTGSLLVEVTATGENAFLNRIANEVKEARSMKPGIIKLADRVLKYFVPGVLSIAAVTLLLWITIPPLLNLGFMIERGIFAALAVLVLGYPCALGMATPLALTHGGMESVEKGILIRSGDAFQVLPKVDTIVLDKTGTITHGEPKVIELTPVNSEKELIKYSASAESHSEHPLGEAVVRYTEEHDIEKFGPDSFQSVTGKGVRSSIEGEEVLVGKLDWLRSEEIDLERAEIKEKIHRSQKRGLTVIGCAVEGELMGLIGIGDEIKEDAFEVIEVLKRKDIEPLIITGDDEITGKTAADKVGVNSVLADVLPEQKRSKIRELQDKGKKIAMVGDGINDAPALMQADIGLAIGAGTDITIESADMIIMTDELSCLLDAHEIAEKSYKKTKQNLTIAFTTNGVGVGLATTGLLHPVFAMIAMGVSVSAVLLNSLGIRILKRKSIDFDFDPSFHADD